MKKITLLIVALLVSALSFSQAKTEKEKNELQKLMQFDKDKFEGITKVKHKPLMGNSDFKVNCTFSIKDNKPTDLRLRVVHFGKSWLFLNRINFLIDDKQYAYDVSPSRIVRDGYCVEIADMPASGKLKDIVTAFMKSDNIELRYTGENSHDDTKNLKLDIKRARKVVDYYLALGGE